MYSPETAQYGRRILIGLVALLSASIQSFRSGSIGLTIAILWAQLGALLFGGTPGTLSWLLFSRRASSFPNRMRWDGAMHAFIAVSLIAFLTLGTHLSEQFLGCTGGLLLLSYGCAKQGCYRLGCCGWVSDHARSSLFTDLRSLIQLQKLEALLSFAAGALVMTAAAFDSVRSESLFFIALAIHLGLRELFAPARAG